MPLPISSAPFFQEYDFQKLKPEDHSALIIERLLAYGNRAETRWLVETYGWNAVRDWIAQSGANRLPAGRYRLWCIVFEIPQEERSGGIWPH